MTWIFAIAIYLILSLIATHLVHEFPRRPVKETPDWGKVEDTTILTKDNGFLELWRVEPDFPGKGAVVLAHGWSRNRDRMTPRARVFGKMGFTTIMHSARDHGNSSPKRWMHAEHFASDIETVLEWVGKPVILYGHSAGAGGAIIAASRCPNMVRLLILEGCYTYTNSALLRLYLEFNLIFGILFGPMIILWMNVFYRKNMRSLSPACLAKKLHMPVLLIHGENDKKFPPKMAQQLQNSFTPGQASVYIAKGAGHSDSPTAPGYEKAIAMFIKNHENQLKIN